MSVNAGFKWLLRCLAFVSLLSSFHLAAAGYKDITKAPAGEYQLDKTHGYVTFSYFHQGFSRPWLRFRDIDGTLVINPEAIEQSSVSVDIAAASIDSGVDVFDEHLRGGDYFDVEKYPAITFRSNTISFDGQQFTLNGALTMKNITKSITLNGTFNKGGKHFKSKKPILGFSATGQLKRSDWGLGNYVPFVGDRVDIVVEVEFIQP